VINGDIKNTFTFKQAWFLSYVRFFLYRAAKSTVFLYNQLFASVIAAGIFESCHRAL